MNKKSYRAIIKRADLASELRRGMADGSIKFVKNGNDFRIFHSNVELGSFTIPAAFMKFVEKYYDPSGTVKHSVDEAFKYVLDGVLVPTHPQAIQNLESNLNKSKRGTYQSGENVHFDSFQLGKVACDVENTNMPIVKLYLHEKPKIIKELTNQISKPMPKNVPGTARAQSRVIRKKIIARAKKNKGARNA